MISLTPYQTLLWSLTDDSISNQYITKSSSHPSWSVHPEETTLLTTSETVKLLNQTNMAQITSQPQHPLHGGPPSTATNTFHRRNQFISTYKTKKLKRTTAVDQALTAQSSHTDSADCKLDAALYTQPRLGPRSDVEVYISLYGLEPRVVERIGKLSDLYHFPQQHTILTNTDYAPTIMLLNLCATVIAAEEYTPTYGFLLQLMVFLNVFEESGFEGGYLEVDTSPVQTEHMQLLSVLNREVENMVEGW